MHAWPTRGAINESTQGDKSNEDKEEAIRKKKICVSGEGGQVVEKRQERESRQSINPETYNAQTLMQGLTVELAWLQLVKVAEGGVSGVRCLTA